MSTAPKTHRVKSYLGQKVSIDGTRITADAELTANQVKLLQQYIDKRKEEKKSVPTVELEPIRATGGSSSGSSSSSGS